MEKKMYVSPLMEVEQVNLQSVVLAGSPGASPVPPHPAPRRGDFID